MNPYLYNLYEFDKLYNRYKILKVLISFFIKNKYYNIFLLINK